MQKISLTFEELQGFTEHAQSSPPDRERKLVYIRVIPSIACMSVQLTCSGLWGELVCLCPRKFPLFLFSFFPPPPTPLFFLIWKKTWKVFRQSSLYWRTQYTCSLQKFGRERVCFNPSNFPLIYFVLISWRLGLVLVKFREPGAYSAPFAWLTSPWTWAKANKLVFFASPINAIYEDGPVELPILGQDEQQYWHSVLWR